MRSLKRYQSNYVVPCGVCSCLVFGFLMFSVWSSNSHKHEIVGMFTKGTDLTKSSTQNRVLCLDPSSSKDCFSVDELTQAVALLNQKKSGISTTRISTTLAPNVIRLDSGHETMKILKDAETFEMRSTSKTTEFERSYDTGLNAECKYRNYGDLKRFPKASVIIAFCENEQLADLLHTVHSIIQRTPPELIEEVLLIDDNTTKAEFKEMLDNYCSAVFNNKVRVVRSDTRLGLIKARLLGARLAKGEVIVSMDAHMEVQDTWLEALLWEIMQNPKTMGTAMLDWMMPKANNEWTYRQGINSFICFFALDLGFGFGYGRPEIDGIRQINKTLPLPAPCSVGTIWAIQKKFFTEIGELDEGMERWGGENLDLPIRVWLFGGRAVQVPCSHAAHLERPHQRDYRFGWDVYSKRNHKRVLEVWFDEYKEHVYRIKPDLLTVDMGDISSRLELKKKALHNMTWFFSNVYPEMGLYNNDTFGHDWLKNIGLNKCLHRIGLEPLIVWECLGQIIKEGVFMTTDGYLRTDTQTYHAKGKHLNSVIQGEGATGTFRVNWLAKWIHWKGGPMMLFEEDGKGTSQHLCMEGLKNQTVLMRNCDPHNRAQRWQWKVYTKDYTEFMEKGTNSRFNTKYHREILDTMKTWTKLTESEQISTHRH